jgi:hypothetical protein
MTNVWVSIKITNYGMNNNLNYGHIYISIGNKLELCHRVTFQEAVKEMAKLAKALGRPPKLVNNWYGPDISYRELAGFVDWE